MGFFQGVARAYGEISERKEREGARKAEFDQRKAEREETRGWQIEDRNAAMAEKRRDQLFALGVARGQVSSSAKDYANAPVALEGMLGELADTPDGKLFVKNAYGNPKAAKKILDLVNGSKRAISPSELIQYEIVGNTNDPGIITEVDYESVDVTDRDAYEEAYRSLQLPSTQEAVIVVPDAVKNDYSPQEITFAAEQFESAVENAAFNAISGMSEAEKQNTREYKLLQLKKNGDPLAAMELNELYGAQAAWELQGNEFITALKAVPELSSFMSKNQELLELLNGGDISEEVRTAILSKYPHLAQGD
jgi:hypothetical protein